MPRWVQLFRPAFAVLLAGAGLAPVPAAPRAATGGGLAEHPVLVFFSTLTERPLARLEAVAVTPRFTRHGPFRLPAPGLAVAEPRLLLLDTACAPDDWRRLVAGLAGWRRLPAAGPFTVRLPDGRLLAFVRPPSVRDEVVTGLVRPAGAGPDATLADALVLRLRHDGSARLGCELTPLRALPLPSTQPPP